MNGNQSHSNRNDGEASQEVSRIQHLLDRLGETDRSHEGLSDRVYRASVALLPVSRAMPAIETIRPTVRRFESVRSGRRGWTLAACMALLFFGGVRLLTLGPAGPALVVDRSGGESAIETPEPIVWLLPPTPISDPASERHDLAVVVAESMIDLSGLRYDDLEGELEVFETVLARR